MSPVPKIRALRCSQFHFRLGGGAGFLAGIATWVVASVLGTENAPRWVLVVFGAVLLAFIWLSERRPAVWIIQQPDGGVAVHRRQVFWKRDVGIELALHPSDSEMSYETSAWWQAPKLRVGSEAFYLLREAHPYAKALAGETPAPVYRKINGRG